MRKRLRWLSGLLLLPALGLFALYLVVPTQILARYHEVSAQMGEHYRGSAGAAELDLIRPGYRLTDLRIAHRGPARDTPLVAADAVIVRLNPLTRRARLLVQGLRLDLVAGGRGAQLGEGVPWRHFVDELAPGFDVDRIDLVEAHLDLTLASFPDATVTLDDWNLSLRGLASDVTAGSPMPATLIGTAMLMQHATLGIDGRFDPRGPMDRLELQLDIDALSLPRLDAYARAWNGIDFEAGSATVDVSLASNGPDVSGTMKAELQDIDIFDAREDLGRDGDGPLRAAREMLTGSGAAVMRDPRMELRIDARVKLPDDNLEGVRAVIAAGLADIDPT